MVSMNGLMGEGSKVTGKTIRWTVEEFLIGQITDNMRVNTEMIRKKDKVILFGQMDVNTKEDGLMVNSMVWVFISQAQVKNVRASGKTGNV